MAFVFTPLFTDNFQRPNEEPLNPANWSVPGAADLAVVSHLCVGQVSTGGGVETYKGSVIPPDQYTAATLNQFGLTSELDVFIRANAATTTGYRATLLANGDGTGSVQLDDAATQLPLAGPVLIGTISLGDVLETWAVGTSIFVSYNGAQVLSTTNVLYASGRPALRMLFTAVQTDTSVSLFVTGSVANAVPVLPYSEPDCRNYGQFPNNSVNVNQTLTYTVPAHPSYVAPVDSRVAKPVASGTYPQNSRTPGTFGPGE
jgi:hypothetical protein